jgi:HSP20 family protein
MAEKRTDVAAREQRGLSRRDPFMDFGNPFRVLERFADEMDRVFDDLGLGHGSSTPRTGSSSWLRTPLRVAPEWQTWAPDMEAFHRNNEFIVRADLPGLSRDDVKVDVSDEGITIQGERKREHEEEREGVYRSERSYGSFYRVIPVPEGAIVDQAKATFKDGVLEIAMPAPPEQVRRGRRLEITDRPAAKK